MAKSDPIRTVDDLAAFIATDPRADCAGCRSAYAEAHANALAFGDWWLSEAQRNHWGVGTHVVANPAKKEPKIGLSFRIETPAFPEGRPVALIVFQHGKADPHYQMQIPSSDMVSQSIKDEAARDRIQDIWTRYSRDADVFRTPGVKSISMHRAFTDKTRDSIFAIASRLVEDLREVRVAEG
jgi:hypothetical protein